MHKKFFFIRVFGVKKILGGFGNPKREIQHCEKGNVGQLETKCLDKIYSGWIFKLKQRKDSYVHDCCFNDSNKNCEFEGFYELVNYRVKKSKNYVFDFDTAKKSLQAFCYEISESQACQ